MVTQSTTEEFFNKSFNVEGTWQIDPVTHEISVKGNVLLRSRNSQLPVAFHEVQGEFWASSKHLSSWKGFPTKVTKWLMVDNNKFGNWDHAPVHVGSHLDASNNPIKNLVGMPHVDGSLDLEDCLLTNLKGLQPHLKSWINVRGNPLQSLEGFEQCDGYIALDYDPNLPMLRCLNAKQGVRVYSGHHGNAGLKVFKILDKYKGQGKRAMLNCALDLKAAGFEGNAKW